MKKIKEGEKIFFPNLQAKISFISSDQAASALAQLTTKEITGPLNIASPTPISLKRFIDKLEKHCGKKALICDNASSAPSSPYGIADDAYMDCKEMERLHLRVSEIESCLDDILARCP